MRWKASRHSYGVEAERDAGATEEPEQAWLDDLPSLPAEPVSLARVARRGVPAVAVAGTLVLAASLAAAAFGLPVLLAKPAAGSPNPSADASQLADATPQYTRSSEQPTDELLIPSEAESDAPSPSPSAYPTATQSSSPSSAPPGRFKPTGSMGSGDVLQAAVTLRDGRVLLLPGSEYDGSPTVSALLYDPRTGTFGRTGPMVDVVSGPQATLLADGRVLVTGGFDPREQVPLWVPKAELFDPTTNTFSATGSMTAGRYTHSATLLKDGRVLVVGGDPTGTPSAELYDPATGKFGKTGDTVRMHQRQTATLLTDGRVLITGGLDDGGPTARAELYDPGSGTFSATGSMSATRDCHIATRLLDGRVLVAGGGNNSADIYDPATGTFSATGSMSVSRAEHVATLLADGHVLVAGGYNGWTHPLASAETYDPATGQFSSAGNMTTIRGGPAIALLSDGRVLIAGGVDASGNALSSAEIYTP